MSGPACAVSYRRILGTNRSSGLYESTSGTQASPSRGSGDEQHGQVQRGALRHTGRVPARSLATTGAQRGHRRATRSVVGLVAAHLRGRSAGGAPGPEAGSRCRAPSEGELRLLAGPCGDRRGAPARPGRPGLGAGHYRGLVEQLASERRGGGPGVPLTSQRMAGRSGGRLGTWTIDPTGPAGEGGAVVDTLMRAWRAVRRPADRGVRGGLQGPAPGRPGRAPAAAGRRPLVRGVGWQLRPGCGDGAGTPSARCAAAGSAPSSTVGRYGVEVIEAHGV